MDVERLNRTLEGAHPSEIMAWAQDRFGSELVVTSSFQTQSLPLLHLLASTAPEIPILFLDTGYHFPETLEFRDELIDAWGLNAINLHGDKQAEYASQRGHEPLYHSNPDRCCFINKVEPLREALQGYTAWISGIRRDQSPARADARPLEVADKVEYRVHPMVAWTRSKIRAYIEAHDLPHHPLEEFGYRSIGCAPCTAPPEPGQGERSGRWEDREKTECGLHTELRGRSDQTRMATRQKDT